MKLTWKQETTPNPVHILQFLHLVLPRIMYRSCLVMGEITHEKDALIPVAQHIDHCIRPADGWNKMLVNFTEKLYQSAGSEQKTYLR
jgi:hypothetical protein